MHQSKIQQSALNHSAVPCCSRANSKSISANRALAIVSHRQMVTVAASAYQTAPHLEQLKHQNQSVDQDYISRDSVRDLEANILDTGAGVESLRRFNNALRRLSELEVREARTRLRCVMSELTFNLESFNPIFTAVVLAVQDTVGVSRYGRRDDALAALIHPLAGEYGLVKNKAQQPTHRQLFNTFYKSLFNEEVQQLIDETPAPRAAQQLYSKMISDVRTGGGSNDVMLRAVYGLGYNLAVEYIADYEKTWMLDSFRALSSSGVIDRQVDWRFLEVHAEGESEHAALGHRAVCSFCSKQHETTLQKAMKTHDRDFAIFYNQMAAILEGQSA